MENKNDDLVFEMEDYMYLHEWFLEIVLAVVSFLLLFFDMLHGINKSFAHIAIIYIAVSSIRKFYEFFIEKNKKLFFYKYKIERTNKKIELKISDIDEIYKISSIYSVAYTGVKRTNNFKIVLSVIFSWFFIPLLMLVNVLLSIYYKKIAIQKVLVIIGKTDNEVIIIPIPYHDKEKYEKLSNYFKVYLNTDINNLQTKYFIPQKG